MQQANDKKRSPLISVITLSYNSEYLMESIRSVLRQTYENIQYVIVDDGSKEFDEQEIIHYLDSHKGNNLREYSVLVNRQNQGTVKAFNRALRQSKGDYVFNLSADDLFYDPHVLEEWVSEFERRDSLCMMGQMAVYSQDLKTFKGMLPHPQEAQLLETGDTESIFEAMTRGNFIIGCSTARSRKVLEQYGYFDESYFLLEDYPYALRLLREKVCIDYWARPVVRYRQGGVSAPQNFNRIYERDSDLNFKKEILPYVRYPLKAVARYYYWKFGRIERGKFLKQYQAMRDQKRLYLVPLLCLRYPILIIRGVNNRIVKMIRGKQ